MIDFIHVLAADNQSIFMLKLFLVVRNYQAISLILRLDAWLDLLPNVLKPVYVGHSSALNVLAVLPFVLKKLNRCGKVVLLRLITWNLHRCWWDWSVTFDNRSWLPWNSYWCWIWFSTVDFHNMSWLPGIRCVLILTKYLHHGNRLSARNHYLRRRLFRLLTCTTTAIPCLSCDKKSLLF